jgi:hypothetical protein
LTSFLAHFGITADVYADNVDSSASGTAGEFDRALSVTQRIWGWDSRLPGPLRVRTARFGIRDRLPR